MRSGQDFLTVSANFQLYLRVKIETACFKAHRDSQFDQSDIMWSKKRSSSIVESSMLSEKQLLSSYNMDKSKIRRRKM